MAISTSAGNGDGPLSMRGEPKRQEAREPGHITVNLYTLWGVGGGFAFRFLDPLLKSGLPWAVNLSVSEQWWIYDQPDVVVDPNTMRYQNDTILSLVLTVPFDDGTTLSLSGGAFRARVNGAELRV